jgi:hypothetical protein
MFFAFDVNGRISRAYGGAAVINALQFNEMIAIISEYERNTLERAQGYLL